MIPFHPHSARLFTEDGFFFWFFTRYWAIPPQTEGEVEQGGIGKRYKGYLSLQDNKKDALSWLTAAAPMWKLPKGKGIKHF